jgi:hypothetical protein
MKMLNKEQTTYIPAQPGWRLVYYANDVAPNDHKTANFVIMDEEPIIAWAIVPGGPGFLPVTYSAGVMDKGGWIVRRPDGMVDAGRGWESEEDCFCETLPDLHDFEPPEDPGPGRKLLRVA